MPYDAGYTRRGYRRSAWGGDNRITSPSAVRFPRQCPAAGDRKGILQRTLRRRQIELPEPAEALFFRCILRPGLMAGIRGIGVGSGHRVRGPVAAVSHAGAATFGPCRPGLSALGARHGRHAA